MKNVIISVFVASFAFLTGCEKTTLNPNQTKFYTVNFEESPGRFLLENDGETITANGATLNLTVKISYNESSKDNTAAGTYTTTFEKTIKTDSAGRMDLDIHPASETRTSWPSFAVSTTQYKKDGSRVLIGQINSIDVLIKTVKNGVTYQKQYTVDSSAYFWNYLEGFFPLFGSDLPEIESRSTATSEHHGNLTKYWYLKLVSDITLHKV